MKRPIRPEARPPAPERPTTAGEPRVPDPEDLAPRSPADSLAILTTTILPADTNAYGNLFGGALVAMIDKTASITASRHARRNVVTASIDRVDFIQPIRLGDIVTIRSRLNYTGRTSMEIGVEAHSEDRRGGAPVHACSAMLTFVAIDDAGHPGSVPPLEVTTDEDRRLFAAGKARAAARRNATG
jgi:acyl-CoA hydrolase